MCAKLRVVNPEDDGEPIERYLTEVKAGSTNPLPYERLMIYYRKLKNYKEEVAVIGKGIDTLKAFYQRQQAQVFGSRVPASIKNLSDKINKSTGLHDKKGNTLYLPDPLPKWINRKLVAESKLKAQIEKASGNPPAKKKKAAGKRRRK